MASTSKTTRKPRKRQETDVYKLIYKRLCEGIPDEEIADELNVDDEQFEKLKLDAFKAKALEYKQKPPEHTYVEYVIEQKKTLEMLNKLIRDLAECDDPKVAPARVSAMRTRADILDRMVSTGQTLGMVDKAADVTKVVGGFVFEQLGREDIKTLIFKELEGLKRIVDTTAVPIEQVTVPPLHYGDSGDENAVQHVADDDDD